MVKYNVEVTSSYKYIKKYISMWNNCHKKLIGKKDPPVTRKDRKEKALGFDMDLWEGEAICKREKVHMGGLSSWDCAGQGKSWAFQSCSYEQRRESSFPAEKSPRQSEGLEKPRLYCKQASMLAIKVKRVFAVLPGLAR